MERKRSCMVTEVWINQRVVLHAQYGRVVRRSCDGRVVGSAFVGGCSM